MKEYKYAIIGGGIAGVSAAEAIRERDAEGSIAIFSAEPHLPYSRVLLPSYLKNKIARERVFIRTGESFSEKNIDFFSGMRAVSLDAARKIIAFSNGDAAGCEKLLIAAGGSPVPWGREEDQKYIHRLQTLDDADRLIGALPGMIAPVVVGSSFIALEFLEIFSARGKNPKIIVRGPHLFSSMLDAQGGALLADNLQKHGVELMCGERIEKTEQENSGILISTGRGRRMSADCIAVGIGIKRNADFLAASGVRAGKTGMVTDEFLETNIPGVFAAGDIAEQYDPIAGAYRSVGNWTHAMTGGRRAGMNMAGDKKPFQTVPAYSITNFGMQISAVGVCDNHTEAITRTDHSRKKYERFFFREGIITGAFLINCFSDRAHILALIEAKTALGAYRNQLDDFGFDIRSIPLV